MNRTVWIVIGALCIIGLGGLAFYAKKDNVNVDNINPTAIIATNGSTIGDHVYGNQNAKVVVFEYADFQCPGCAAAHTNMDTIKQLYKDQVAFVYRDFPLTSIHPNAMATASAAEAAGLQGKFWEMGDLLFTNRDAIFNLSADQRTSYIVGLAQQLGLNIDQFNKDMASSAVQTKIQTDRAIGNKLNVTATPTVYIGSNKMDDTTINDFIQQQGAALMGKIDQALKDAGETPPTH